MGGCGDELCGWTATVPDGLRLVGTEWDCDDDYCGSAQAGIYTYERREPFGDQGAVYVWEGPYHTDHQSGAHSELNHMAQHLRRHHHDLYARCEWPWDRTKKDCR